MNLMDLPKKRGNGISNCANKAQHNTKLAPHGAKGVKRLTVLLIGMVG